MRTQVEQRFETGDPVREYWLARGEGFAVETAQGRKLGRVVDVVLDAEEGRIDRIVVRSQGLRAVRARTKEIPSEQVAAAVPARKAFVLDRPRRARTARARRQLRGDAWDRLRPRAAAAARTGWEWAVRTGRVAARTGWEWAVRTGRVAARVGVAVAYALGVLALLVARFAADLVRAVAQRARREWALARRPR